MIFALLASLNKKSQIKRVSHKATKINIKIILYLFVGRSARAIHYYSFPMSEYAIGGGKNS